MATQMDLFDFLNYEGPYFGSIKSFKGDRDAKGKKQRYKMTLIDGRNTRVWLLKYLANSARGLIRLVRCWEKMKNPIPLEHKVFLGNGHDVTDARAYGNWGLNETWGFARKLVHDEDDGCRSHFWFPTDRGIRFVRGELTIWSHVERHKDIKIPSKLRVRGWRGERLNINDALKDNKFVYRRLMDENDILCRYYRNEWVIVDSVVFG